MHLMLNKSEVLTTRSFSKPAASSCWNSSKCACSRNRRCQVSISKANLGQRLSCVCSFFCYLFIVSILLSSSTLFPPLIFLSTDPLGHPPASYYPPPPLCDFLPTVFTLLSSLWLSYTWRWSIWSHVAVDTEYGFKLVYMRLNCYIDNNLTDLRKICKKKEKKYHQVINSLICLANMALKSLDAAIPEKRLLDCCRFSWHSQLSEVLSYSPYV